MKGHVDLRYVIICHGGWQYSGGLVDLQDVRFNIVRRIEMGVFRARGRGEPT